MLKKRIIPCLDIKEGKVVKGVNFEDIMEAGDPLVLARRYVEEGADELVFLDISATTEQRKTVVDLVVSIAKEINIPFTVGGGITCVSDAKAMIAAGADKVSVNSAALLNPGLITSLAAELGSQCVVLAIDTKYVDGDWQVFRGGGKIATGLSALSWAKEGVALGAGEILLTSMSNDGMQEGFAIAITKAISAEVTVPVIASGGAGSKVDFETVFRETKVTGALAASVFHYNQLSIPALKTYLKGQNISVR